MSYGLVLFAIVAWHAVKLLESLVLQWVMRRAWQRRIDNPQLPLPPDPMREETLAFMRTIRKNFEGKGEPWQDS